MSDEREKILLVQRVDMWAQENDKYLDKKFQCLYSGDEGWDGVYKDDLPNFYRAYALALENRERTGL